MVRRLAACNDERSAVGQERTGQVPVTETRRMITEISF
jgi:hypothetical protein